MKTVVVLPAYNAAKTLERTVKALPPVDEIILVDDCSSDGTYELASGLGIQAFRHDKNRGYGANQKTCYAHALEAGADVVVMVHPDYQYDPRVVSIMTELIRLDICDIVLGNRIRSRDEALKGGMPLYKYIANRCLTIVENLATGQNLGEWHSGLRAYSRKALEAADWRGNSDDFVFDAQMLLKAVGAGLRIGDIPVPAKYFAEASSINFRRSVKYGICSMALLARFVAQSALSSKRKTAGTGRR
ncbi:MAG: glycosyltransferase family 2 protein [Elusimicrobiales bacterium]